MLALAEIFVLENVWRCPDQPEADPFFAGIASWEGIPVQHDYFMRHAMAMVVNYLINSSLTHSLPGAEEI